MFSRRSQFLLLLTAMVAIGACPLWTQSDTKTQGLTNLTFGQLTACYGDLKLCGAHDSFEISDELARRLPSLSSESLVQCFDNWKICGVEEDRASGWSISDELARRGQIQRLLLRYWKEPKWTIRGGIEHVAYHFDSPEVTAFMQKVVSQRMKNGEDRYWPVNYLAKKCDQTALQELSSGKYRNQGSLQYQTSVELFGKCKYRPAIPYLVDAALYDFSLNIVGAAADSLQALYPDAPQSFATLEDTQQYFCQRAREEHLKVGCVPKSKK